MRLVVASENAGKLREFRRLLQGALPAIEPLAPAEAGAAGLSVVEDGATFEENARKKACAYAVKSGLPALADDSGLEVFALDNQPGIYSARYAGPGATDDQNLQKLLQAMDGVPDPKRGARFRCVLVFVDPAGALPELVTEGLCSGRILAEPRGNGGFGYDPIFVPDNESFTLAELEPAQKAALSHRGKATAQMKSLLRTHLSGDRRP